MGRGRNKSGKVWRAKVARVAKAVTLRNVETKRYTIGGANTTSGGAGALIPLYSNGGTTSAATGPYVDFPLLYIDQGDNLNQRTGNGIVLKGMHAHLQVEGDPSFLGNCHVRVTLAWIDPNYTSTPLSYQNVYLNAIGAYNTTTNSFIRHGTDNDSLIRKVVFDRVYSLATINSPASGGSNTNNVPQKLIRINLAFHNKMFRYVSSTAGIGGESEDLIMFMTAYTPGRANTEQVANVRMYRKVYYKDP